MDTEKKESWRITVCSHSSVIYNHIAMCFDEHTGFDKKLIVEYMSMGKHLLSSDTNHGFDALFIDTDLRDTNCMYILQLLRRADPDFVLILLIDNPDQISAGYEFEAFRCLRKGSLYAELETHVQDILQKIGYDRRTVDLRSADSIQHVDVNDILYAEADHHTVIIHFRGSQKRPLHLSNTISAVEEMLTPYGFYRVSRSFVANMTYVEKVARARALMCNGDVLPVGKDVFHEVKDLHRSLERRKRQGKTIS